MHFIQKEKFGEFANSGHKREKERGNHDFYNI